MFDPFTVAFEIKSPFKNKNGYRNALVRVWHKDPCKDGTDNSCDWSGYKRKLNPKEKAISKAVWDLETILDNRPFYPDHPAHLRFGKLKEAVWEWRRRPKFRWHPRWHFHHWRIQVPLFQEIWRATISRCAFCGKGFRWNESVMGNWDGDKIWHHRCDKNCYRESSEPK